MWLRLLNAVDEWDHYSKIDASFSGPSFSQSRAACAAVGKRLLFLGGSGLDAWNDTDGAPIFLFTTARSRVVHTSHNRQRFL
jgi:hypothetical protein